MRKKVMQEREKLKSRLGFLLISAGCAIGVGNVWKFPYMAGQGGGGTFLLFYVLFLVIMGLPIMTMEFASGAGQPEKSGEGLPGIGEAGAEVAYSRIYYADRLLPAG